MAHPFGSATSTGSSPSYPLRMIRYANDTEQVFDHNGAVIDTSSNRWIWMHGRVTAWLVPNYQDPNNVMPASMVTQVKPTNNFQIYQVGGTLVLVKPHFGYAIPPDQMAHYSVNACIGGGGFRVIDSNGNGHCVPIETTPPAFDTPSLFRSALLADGSLDIFTPLGFFCKTLAVYEVFPRSEGGFLVVGPNDEGFPVADDPFLVAPPAASQAQSAQAPQQPDSPNSVNAVATLSPQPAFSFLPVPSINAGLYQPQNPTSNPNDPDRLQPSGTQTRSCKPLHKKMPLNRTNVVVPGKPDPNMPNITHGPIRPYLIIASVERLQAKEIKQIIKFRRVVNMKHPNKIIYFPNKSADLRRILSGLERYPFFTSTWYSDQFEPLRTKSNKYSSGKVPTFRTIWEYKQFLLIALGFALPMDFEDLDAWANANTRKTWCKKVADNWERIDQYLANSGLITK